MSDDLLARLESATGPDRELDAEIWLLVNYPDWRKLKDWRKTNGWAEESRPSSMVSYYTADGLGGSGSADLYTASIDAALTLVPEGWRWHSYYWPRKDEPKIASLVTSEPHAGIAHGKATTPALALCIAALRARRGA